MMSAWVSTLASAVSLGHKESRVVSSDFLSLSLEFLKISRTREPVNHREFLHTIDPPCSNAFRITFFFSFFIARIPTPHHIQIQMRGEHSHGVK